MNIGATKHYSLLLQDDGDSALYEGVAHDDVTEQETVMSGDFHTIIEEDEADDNDEDTLNNARHMNSDNMSLSSPGGRLDIAGESDDDEEYIFDGSRNVVAQDKPKLGGHSKNDYQLLTNGDSDSGSATSLKGGTGAFDQARLSAVWTPTPMSPARRACVLATVMLGVLVTVVFVWIMPCGVDDLCGVPHNNGPHDGQLSADYDDAWMQVLDGIGVNETLSIVDERTGRGALLVSYYEPVNASSADALWRCLAAADCRRLPEVDEGSRRGSGLRAMPSGGAIRCGLALLSDASGARVWQTPLSECPTRTLCHLMSHESERSYNCLAIGRRRLVRLFDPRTGRVVWDTSHREESGESPIMTYPGLPVLIPDVTGDSKPDLLFPGAYQASFKMSPHDDTDLGMSFITTNSAHTTTDHRLSSLSAHSELLTDRAMLKYTSEEDTSSSFPEPRRGEPVMMVNEMILISGSTGEVVGQPFKVKQCHLLTEIAIDGESIDYSCIMLSGNKLAGKIPVISLIHQMVGPRAPEGGASSNLSYPSITPFLPTPDGLPNRYCQVEVTNTGQCPLCDAKVKLMSTTEGENVWQAQYDGSIILDWEPLIVGEQCRGLVLKIMAWDPSNTLINSFVGPINNQRTTRSSFGDNDDEEEDHEEMEEDDAEEGFSAAGEQLEPSPSEEKAELVVPAAAPQYLVQLNDPMKKRNAMFGKRPPVANSMFFNPPSFRVRHNRVKHNDDKNYPRFYISENAEENQVDFGHPVMMLRNGKRNVMYVKNLHDGGAKFIAEAQIEKTLRPAAEVNPQKIKISPKLAAVYSKDLDSGEASDNNYPIPEQQHSTEDFELPIDVFGLPVDLQPPSGFTLQRLTLYTMLVKFNGSAWVDVPLKKAPLFQLCKHNLCVPHETLSRKLVVTPVGDSAGVWQVVNAITTIAHETSLYSSTKTDSSKTPLEEASSDDRNHNDDFTSASSTGGSASEKDSSWTVKTFVSKILISL
ncbi:uncharacterized protein LOC108676832 [Hyalella azteca]|uniref:Uncharacterized protein LOC108676832 n=1 Tax=Hyalella azteca TaxID=294128 RepID=A0A8B7P369_HYAAZ|nr:uncharacterized protein LOC108676832 [Hyalella azteca]